MKRISILFFLAMTTYVVNAQIHAHQIGFPPIPVNEIYILGTDPLTEKGKWYTGEELSGLLELVNDHGELIGLFDDDHTQYALLAGRTGGQILKGGTGIADDLILQTTAGVGSTGADMIFRGGNNGATEFMRILNSGLIGINHNNPTARLSISDKLRLFDVTPTSAVSTTKMGYLFNNVSPAGSILENTVDGDILSYAINVPQIGNRNINVVGGIFRLDTRPSIGFSVGQQSLILLGYPTGGSVSNSRLIVSLQDGNTALNPAGGWTAIGHTAASAKLHILSTTEQFRSGYNTSNYWNATTASTGATTFDAFGSNQSFLFADKLGYQTNGGTPTTLTGRDGTFFTDISLGSGLSFSGNTLNVTAAGVSDHDWYESGDTAPDAIYDDMYHIGEVHIGDNTMIGTGKLNVVGRIDQRYPSLALANIMIGKDSGNSSLSGDQNIGIGSGALPSLTSGNGNIGIGGGALTYAVSGDNNVAIGNSALSNYTGSNNVAVGYLALQDNVSATGNVAVGPNALQKATAFNNTGIGSGAVQKSTTGTSNTGVGAGALNENTIGINNTGLGAHAGGHNLEGSYNVSVGTLAGFGAVGSYSYNTILGAQAGFNLNGDGNVFIGQSAGFNETGSNKFIIDNQTETTPSNHYIYGDMSVPSLKFNSSLHVTDELFDSSGDAGTNGQILSSTGSQTNWIDAPSGAIPINDLLAADGTNTIDNGNFQQEWQWNTLGEGTGLKLTSNSTTATAQAQKLLDVFLTGANSNANQTTWAASFTNQHTGTNPSNIGISAFATGNNAKAVFAGSDSGTGIHGYSTSNFGIQGHSTSGIGMYARTNEGSAALLAQNFTASTDDVKTLINMYRASSGNEANGIGAALDYAINTSDNVGWVANRLISKWTNATSATRTSQFILSGVNSAVTSDLLTIDGDGSAQLNKYGDGIFPGTAAYLLGVDMDGNIIETSTSGGGGNQNLTIEGTGPTYDIAISDGTDVTIAAGGIVSLSESPANTLVISATEVDGLTDNEGSLIVEAGSPTTAEIHSNTPGSVDITLTAGSGIGITENVSLGTITITNAGDVNGGDDLTTSTVFSGDVSGLYNNLQLGTAVVGVAEIGADAVGPSELISTGVTAGTYTLATVTVDVDGRITSAANGTEVDGSITNEGQWVIDADDADTEVVGNQTIKFAGLNGIVTDYVTSTNTLEIEYTGSGGGNGIYGGSGTVPVNTTATLSDGNFKFEGATANIKIEDTGNTPGLTLEGNIGDADANYGKISFNYTDASYQSGNEQTGFSINANRETDNLIHSTLTINTNQAVQNDVLIFENFESLSDNNAGTYTQINSGVAYSQYWESSSANAITLDRGYYNVVLQSGHTGTITLPEIESAFENYLEISAAGVSVGQEYVITNFSASPVTIASINNTGSLNDDWLNGVESGTFILDPNKSIIVKAVTMISNEGRWFIYD